MLFFLGAGMLAHLLLPLRVTDSGFGWRAMAALAPLAASGLLALSASRALRRSGTPVHPDRPTTAIVKDGPFRFTRNPLYLSLMLLYGGLSVLFNSLWPLILLPLLFAAFHFGMVLREERYLERKFGEEYLGYRSRVRRWL